MKKKFSTAWNSSKQPRKQRKYRANAPLHIKKNFVRSNLSKDLRSKQGVRTMQLKKGDTVKVMVGKFKGKTGKVLSVRLRDSQVFVEGMQIKKMDGSKVNVKIQPSNLQITALTDRGSKKQAKKDLKKQPEKNLDKKTDKKPEGDKK